MPDWLAKLLPDHLHLNISVPINIQIGSFGNDKKEVFLKNNDLFINDSKPEGERIAKKVITELPKNLQENDIELEEGVPERLEVITSTMSTSSYAKQLKHYSKFVPAHDREILEASIIIRKLSNDGESVSRQKSDIVQRFGPRGGMISNLFSAGYFDSLIEPVYKDLLATTITPEEYVTVYEMIVTESPLAVFIGVGNTLPEVTKKILEKIETNIDLDIHFLNIHGIGTSNIRKIRLALVDNQIANLLRDIPNETIIGRAIKVRIIF
jgi:hypothetical protein